MGTTTTTAQASTPTERWQYAPGSVSNILGYDGTYYITAGDTVQAIDATSGEIRWTASTGGAVQEDAFAISATSGNVIAVTENGTALAVAIDDGDEQWRRSAGGNGIGVTVVDETAYILAGETVQEIDIPSGEPAWSHSIPDDVRSEGLVRGVDVVTTDSLTRPVYHTDAYIVGLDTSGNQRWQVRPAGPGLDDIPFRFSNNSLATQGRYVYFLGHDGAHGVADAEGGELIWERVDDYANRTEKRGGPATFGDAVVNSGRNATVLSIPGGRQQWTTGMTTYDGLQGTENALYVAGNAGGTATIRSFSDGGGINWTLEFGEYQEYDRLTRDEYQFYNIPPAVTDGSLLLGVTAPNGERALRCYQLPESEWLASPQRETDSQTTTSASSGTDGTSQTTTTSTDSGENTQTGAPTQNQADGSERGFFTNGSNGPLSTLTGANLTILSTLITVLGIFVTLFDLIRGGDE